MVAVLFRLLDAMRMFDLPYVLLGRLRSGQTLSMLATDAASKTDFGMASAYSMVLFAYICLVAFLFVKLLGADVIGDRDRPAQAAAPPAPPHQLKGVCHERDRRGPHPHRRGAAAEEDPGAAPSAP